jgi:hypothetical protein
MDGRWVVLPNNSEVLAVHAALLRTRQEPDSGEIILFSGSEYDPALHNTGQLDHSRMFNCRTMAIGAVGSPGTDVFCSGHALLGDGRLLVVGGTQIYAGDAEVTGFHAGHLHWPGVKQAWVFDPGSRRWLEAPDMAKGRWYPTVITLGTGQGLTIGGHVENTDLENHYNVAPEIFSSNTLAGSWQLLPLPPASYGTGEGPNPREYPRLHVLPNGVIFCSSPLEDDEGRGIPLKMQAIHPATGQRAFLGMVPADPDYQWVEGTSVLLPLLPENGYRMRVLLCGAKQPLVADFSSVVAGINNGSIGWNDEANHNLIDWTATSPRALSGSPVRLDSNAVILPTGEILVCGGVEQVALQPGAPGGPPVLDPCGNKVVNSNTITYPDDQCVLTPEIYTPKQSAQLESDDWVWQTLPAASVKRNYHSVALLMPDGRVWTAGSNRGHCPGIAFAELQMEIFEPDYVHAARPVITSVPRTIRYGSDFAITVTGKNIKRVALLRASSVTHAFSSDQRYVGLKFALSPTGRDWIVSAPPNANIAPPGQYLMFAIDDHNVPSVGRFVHLWEPWYSISPPSTSNTNACPKILWSPSNPNHLDMFVVRNDGTVLSSFWEPAKGWVPWFSISPPGTASPHQPVTALWNASNPNHLDVFAVRGDGTVMSSFWQPDKSWVPWFSISPPGTASPNQPVTALWNASNPNHLDVFAVRGDGTVVSSFWEPAKSWVSWFSIGPSGTASPNQPVTALWNASNPNHLDLFAVRGDGTVMSTFWEPAKSWVSWFSISPSGTASPNQPVRVLWNPSNPNHLDVFAVRGDGTVMSTFWEPAKSWISWFSISPSGTASPNQPVRVLWNPSNPNHLDVFAVRGDGTVMSSFWEPAKSWVPWFSIGHPIGRPLALAGVAVAWSKSTANHLDLFAVGQDGTIWGIWWSDFLTGW